MLVCVLDISCANPQTYHFPDAYVGLNTKLRDTMNNLVLKGPQNWQTSVCLPFVQITGTVVRLAPFQTPPPQTTDAPDAAPLRAAGRVGRDPVRVDLPFEPPTGTPPTPLRLTRAPPSPRLAASTSACCSACR